MFVRVHMACFWGGGGGVKAPVVNFSVSKIFNLAKVPLRLFEAQTYLTGVTADELLWHLQNINMVFNILHVFDNAEKLGKLQSRGNCVSNPCPWPDKICQWGGNSYAVNKSMPIVTITDKDLMLIVDICTSWCGSVCVQHITLFGACLLFRKYLICSYLKISSCKCDFQIHFTNWHFVYFLQKCCQMTEFHW